MDHARANAVAVRRQSAENRQRKGDEGAAAAAAAAAARAATALPGVRSSGYSSPAYHPGCECIGLKTAACRYTQQRMTESGATTALPSMHSSASASHAYHPGLVTERLITLIDGA